MNAAFLILICCQCMHPGLMQSLSWDLVTTPPIEFGKQVQLRCTVTGAACCSSFARIWSKGSTQIISNGATSMPLKYTEIVDASNNRFSLIISNLDSGDVDVVYTCTYLNDSPTKTLAQNDSFEYHPSGLCPVTIDNGELVGTLNVAMSAPYPSISAQYGGTNFTSYLKTTIAPVTSSPKFYSINSNIKAKATCGNDEKFTLSVLTGVTTTNICNNVDLCECEKCKGICYGWSILGTTAAAMIILFPIPMLLCILYCCFDPKTVFGKKDSSVIFICPYKGSATNKVSWYLASSTDPILISEGDHILQDSEIKDRVSIVGDHQAGEYNLQLSKLRQSDERVYICRVGRQEKNYKVKLLDGINACCIIVCVITIALFLMWIKTGLNTTQKFLAVVMIFVLSAVLNIIPAVVFGYLKCPCHESTVYWCIAIGAATFIIAAVIVLGMIALYKRQGRCLCCICCTCCICCVGPCVVRVLSKILGYFVADQVEGKKGSTTTLLCPYLDTTTVRWQRVGFCTALDISKGDKVAESPLKSRVTIVENHTAGGYNLQLSELQESDEGLYRCIVGKRSKFYYLKLSGSKSDNGLRYELVSLDSPDPLQ